MAEIHEHGEHVWEGCLPRQGELLSEFVERICLGETQPEPSLVPETTFWATIENEVVGRIAIRHKLNFNLTEFGGHIGYEVRPSCRGKGVAKEMLRQTLLTPIALKIQKLLLTCAPTNTASIKTIERNGGIFEKSVHVERIKRETSYYWNNLRALES